VGWGVTNGHQRAFILKPNLANLPSTAIPNKVIVGGQVGAKPNLSALSVTITNPVYNAVFPAGAVSALGRAPWMLAVQSSVCNFSRDEQHGSCSR